MKTVAILFFVVLVAAQAQAEEENVIKKALEAVAKSQNQGGLNWFQRAVTAAARTRCRWTEKMTQEEEDLIRTNNFTDLTHKQQCFIKCVSDSFTFADIALEVVGGDASPVKKAIDPLVGAKVEACEQQVGADACETSALKYKCYNDLQTVHLI